MSNTEEIKDTFIIKTQEMPTPRIDFKFPKMKEICSHESEENG